MKIDRQNLEAHHVSRELIDGIEAIPSEVEHNTIVFATRLAGELDGLQAESAERIRRDCVRRFLERAKIQIPRGGRLEPVVADVIAEARESARFERERLKPKSVAEVLKPWFGRLDALGWRAAQKTALKGVLQEGEQIIAVDFRTATTDRRTITMDDLREWTLMQRPRWQVDLPGSLRPSEYLAFVGFPDDEAIEKVERVAKHVADQAARPFSATSGPTAGESTVIRR